MELTVDIKKKLQGFTLNVSFQAGQTALGLLGASGSGKSMTLRCIAGLVNPDWGRITLNGRVLFDSEKKINIPCQMRKIGFLFQNYALFPNMTVEENIGFALVNKSREQRRKTVADKIEMVRLDGLEKRYPSQLSGGQQQRVALARALAVEPEVLLLDEPFSALDEHLRSQMTVQMLETLSEYNGPTLFVTHNLDEAYRICPRLLVLSGGAVEAYGEKDALFSSPPSLETAKLTGCKNFSSVEQNADGSLFAKDWGIVLKTPRPSEKVRHVGIRAHYLRWAGEEALPGLSGSEKTENVFNTYLSYTVEAPFRMYVYLCLNRKSTGPGDYHIMWDISRDEWELLRKMPQPWPLSIEDKDLMLMER